MIKVLLDTNVLVSGFASFKHPTRAPAQLLHSWQADFCRLGSPTAATSTSTVMGIASRLTTAAFTFASIIFWGTREYMLHQKSQQDQINFLLGAKTHLLFSRLLSLERLRSFDAWPHLRYQVTACQFLQHTL